VSAIVIAWDWGRWSDSYCD